MREPRFINTDMFKGKESPIRTRNAYAIGFKKGKGGYGYIVTLEKDNEGSSKMKIHTYVNDSNDIIEYVDDEFVSDFFKSLIFY